MIQHLDEIFAIGFNHKKTSTKERGAISICQETKEQIYSRCEKLGISNVCVLSTCNRVEIYGKSRKEEVFDVFLSSLGSPNIDDDKIIVLDGVKALEHIYRVCCGLESQIVGDFEILSQFKLAFKETKEKHHMDGYMERLVDSCLQTAKEVRSRTEITSGTISTSYASVRLLKKQNLAPNIPIVVVGIGNLGKSIARNIRTYFPNNPLTVINRSEEKAQLIAKELNCMYVPFTSLNQELDKSGVVITTISDLSEPIIRQEMLTLQKNRTFIDLSVPTVLDVNLEDHSSNLVYDLDKVSEIINTSLAERKKFIPVVEDIIELRKQEFIEWSSLYDKRKIIQDYDRIIDDWLVESNEERSIAEQERIKKNKVSEFVLHLKKHSRENSCEGLLQDFAARLKH